MTQNLWPRDETAEAVLERVRLCWDFSNGFPLPKWDMHCPQCRTTDIQIRHFTYFERDKTSKTRFRVDVSFKCRACSLVWTHGVVCPQEHFIPQSTEHRSTWQADEVMQLIKQRQLTTAGG